MPAGFDEVWLTGHVRKMGRIPEKRPIAAASAGAAQGRNAPTKYRNTPTGVYASAREAKRAAELKLLAAAGEISELREQAPFVLVPAQFDDAGKLAERACSYIADFVYRDAGGQLVVEDAKGMRTPVYVIKRKLMLFIHNIGVREV
jgi:hypothetical protein